MQTFLPYADFRKSAACLDNKRLNKQIIECKQILMCLTGKSQAWKNHPAVLMWNGYAKCLADYGLALCQEFNNRFKHQHGYSTIFIDTSFHAPPWLGYEPYHSMHRAVLLDKDPEWYGQFGWTEKPAVKVKNQGRMSYPYLWPSKMEQFQ